MTELSRRTLLTSTVAATAAAVAPLATGRSGHAAAPPAGTQAPGWYRYKLGSFEITVVTGRLQGQPDRVTREEHEGVRVVRVPSTAFDR